MNDVSRKEFGRHVMVQRKRSGMTEQQVADLADVKLETVQKIEAGKFNVPFDVLDRVATVLGCRVRLVSNNGQLW